MLRIDRETPGSKDVRPGAGSLAHGGSCQISVHGSSPSVSWRLPIFGPPTQRVAALLELITSYPLAGELTLLRPGQSGPVRFWNPAGSPPPSLGRSGQLGAGISTLVVQAGPSRRRFQGSQASTMPPFPTNPRTLPRNQGCLAGRAPDLTAEPRESAVGEGEWEAPSTGKLEPHHEGPGPPIGAPAAWWRQLRQRPSSRGRPHV